MVQRTDLVGRRIVMRPNSTAFVSHLRAAARESFATVGRWMPWCHPARTEEDDLEWYRGCDENWDNGIEYEFSAFTPGGEYLGAAGLNQFNLIHNFANLGYWVRESRQGQGFAVDAVRLLAEFGFRTLLLRRIEIVAALDNAPSRRVAEKAGARFEGIARNRLLIRGESTDAAMYSLLPHARP